MSFYRYVSCTIIIDVEIYMEYDSALVVSLFIRNLCAMIIYLSLSIGRD